MSTRSIYAQRRAPLAQKIGAGGITIVPTAPEQQRNRDSDFPYRSDSDFYDLTGFAEAVAWLEAACSVTELNAKLPALIDGNASDLDDVIEKRACFQFDMHRTGHWIGKRIEDDAIVTNGGCALLTRDVAVGVAGIEALMRA